MSQQAMTIVSLVGEDLSDLAFIQKKVLDGDYFQVSGDIDVLNDTIEFIVPNGRTAFLIEAKITMSTNPVPPSVNGNASLNNQIVSDLLVDNVVKDKTTVGVASGQSQIFSGSGVGGAGQGFGKPNGKFNVLGLSLVGNGIKKIEVKNVLDNGNAFATMSGYLV
ncbi:MAG: hypothetical protein V3W20_03295 [Candidatus Neomarinimicrobiota bacterium]